jgi:hypothetical protein
MELDDGKILTGKPDQFVGKNHGFRLRCSQQNQSIELLTVWEIINIQLYIPNIRVINPLIYQLFLPISEII